MKITIRSLLVMMMLLAACQAPLQPSPSATPTANDGSLNPQATVIPTATTAAPTAEAKPLPSATPTAVLTATTLPAAASCADFPGWPGCQLAGAARLPLTGSLAWIDSGSGVLSAANFTSGSVWRAPTTGVTRLAWSLDKAQLLVLDKDGAAVYPAAGGILTRAAEKSAQAWLPGGLLLPAGWVANAQGATAHIEVKDGLSTVKMRPPAPSSAETGWLLKSEPADRMFSLLAWLPNSDLLLGQAYFAGNAAMMQGGQLFTLETKTGAVRLLEAYIPLGTAVAPHPTQPGLLALAESGAGGQRLAVLDVLSGKLTVITTDESVWASRPAWTPDGMGLLFAAWVLPLDGPTGAPFDMRAIYLTSPQGGPLVRLTQPPAGFMDDQPRVLAGGKYFLYVRRPIAGGSAELRLGGLDGIYDESVARGVLLGACPLRPGCGQAVWSYVE